MKKLPVAVLFTVFIFLFSCQKNPDKAFVKRAIVNYNFDVTGKQKKVSEKLGSLLALQQIRDIPDQVKKNIDFSFYKYYKNGLSQQLWVFSLKNNMLNGYNAKALISITNGSSSMMILTYHYDKSTFKSGDINTYTGTTCIYDKNLNKTKELVYLKGKITKVISARTKDDKNKPFVIPSTPLPDPIVYHDWCVEFPAVCWGAGGSEGGPQPGEWQIPQDDNPSGGGSSTSDPYSTESLELFSSLLGNYWEDPFYDDVPFPAYDPNIDGPRDNQGYRKNGPQYQYANGTVQNYTDDNGGKYAIFTKPNGTQVKFEGATITNFGILSNRGVTTANGGIHADNSFTLAGLQHEYGHYLQAKVYGTSFYNNIIVPASLLSMIFDSANHYRFWTETNANRQAVAYFGASSDIAANPSNYPTQ
jgi:hypothetical protein